MPQEQQLSQRQTQRNGASQNERRFPVHVRASFVRVARPVPAVRSRSAAPGASSSP